MGIRLFPSVITALVGSRLSLAPKPVDWFEAGSLGLPSPDMLCKILLRGDPGTRESWGSAGLGHDSGSVMKSEIH